MNKKALSICYIIISIIMSIITGVLCMKLSTLFINVMYDLSGEGGFTFIGEVFCLLFPILATIIYDVETAKQERKIIFAVVFPILFGIGGFVLYQVFVILLLLGVVIICFGLGVWEDIFTEIFGE